MQEIYLPLVRNFHFITDGQVGCIFQVSIAIITLFGSTAILTILMQQIGSRGSLRWSSTISTRVSLGQRGRLWLRTCTVAPFCRWRYGCIACCSYYHIALRFTGGNCGTLPLRRSREVVDIVCATILCSSFFPTLWKKS